MKNLSPTPPKEGAIGLSKDGGWWRKRLPAGVALLAALMMWPCFGVLAQPFSRQDTLRGSNGRGRDWWDVQRYDLRVAFDLENRSISGRNFISFMVTSEPRDSMQIDLQSPMILDSVIADGKRVEAINEGNVWWLERPFGALRKGSTGSLTVFYHGKPHEAVQPPWDGGFIWKQDSLGNSWVAVACQGFGASCWWPCKDYQGDEPDRGMTLACSKEVLFIRDMNDGGSHVMRQAPELFFNGKTKRFFSNPATDTRPPRGAGVYDTSRISSPINTYNVTFYLGNYAEWKDTLQGMKGTLPLTFNPLRYHEPQARKQFAVAKDMLRCYEYWLGPYPFYEDGYKLVEAPYLGMEHQSAVAYGNQYKLGYLGLDRSGTGVGKLFDYIIIHESAHEWFGNSITAQDMADNWIHEGFTTYCEVLFAECAYGRDKAFAYMRGLWRNIENDRPVIGHYGVNDAGGSDKYEKGAAVVHMVRAMIGDDEKFRQLLRGLNSDFYHKIVTTDQVERYLEKAVGRDLHAFFDQYLRTTQIPVLEIDWQGHGKKEVLRFRVANAVPGFVLPVSFSTKKMAYADSEWQEVDARDVPDNRREVMKDWLVEVKNANSEK